MVSSLVSDQEDTSAFEEDPEDFADEQGLLARSVYISTYPTNSAIRLFLARLLWIGTVGLWDSTIGINVAIDRRGECDSEAWKMLSRRILI